MTPDQQLKALVERIERIQQDIDDLNADKAEIYKEAKSNGYDVKVLKRVVSERRKDTADRDEQEAIFDLYWTAIHGAPRVHVHEAAE